MKKALIKLIIFPSLATIFLLTNSLNAQTVNINTSVPGPVNPVLNQFLTSAAVRSTLLYTRGGSFGDTASAYVWGRIERLTAPTFVIEPNVSNLAITVRTGMQVTLTPLQIRQAFGNLSSLSVSGAGASNINPSDVVLPDGLYRICFLANQFQRCPPTPGGCNFSNFASGCGDFTVSCSPINSAQINTL